MRRYMAVLFAPDGDYVTDYHDSESVVVVTERLADQGSKWYFYPFEIVVRDHGRVPERVSRVDLMSQRIVDIWEPLTFFRDKRVSTFRKYLIDHPEWPKRTTPMTDREKIDMRELWRAGHTMRGIACLFGISVQRATSIVHEKGGLT